jgi:hypothetical protein
MTNTEQFGQHVTQAYACLIKTEVQLKYPNFYFEKGAVIYDYDTETYMYLGYSDEELKIIMEAAEALQHN